MPHRAGVDLLVGLTASQCAAVTSDAAPLCVVAGAGSGKTRVLTRRVARRALDGSGPAEHTLVVTFTRKAARELRQRLARLGVPATVRAGTFHAVAYAELRRDWADQGKRAPGLLEHPARIVRSVLDESAGVDLVSAVAGEISWAQARLIDPEGYRRAAGPAGRRGPPASQVAEAFAAYEEQKRRRGLVDLNDLILLSAQVLERDPARAAAFRWRTRHLYVDEFQDVNPAQWRLLQAWLGDGTDLFVVGDPNQAVYSWNGADPALMARLADLLPGTAVVQLDANHRSSPQILAAASAVLGDDRSAPSPAEGRGDGPAPVVRAFDDDDDEAAAVVRWLRQVRPPGGSWSRTAVLARTNARLDPVVRALTRAAIPFRLAGDGADTPEVRRLLLRLRAMAPGRPLRAAVADVLLDEVDGDEAGSGADPAARPGGAERSGARHLLALVDELTEEDPGASVADFTAWVAAAGVDGPDAASSGRDGRVDVATFHRAKGLEWRSVAVVGLEDGTVPIVYATSPAARDEERRLLYVALTRAEEDLWCSWARERRNDTRSWSCEASPLLASIESSLRRREPGTDPGDAPSRLAELRTRLAAAPG